MKHPVTSLTSIGHLSVVEIAQLLDGQSLELEREHHLAHCDQCAARLALQARVELERMGIAPASLDELAELADEQVDERGVYAAPAPRRIQPMLETVFALACCFTLSVSLGCSEAERQASMLGSKAPTTTCFSQPWCR